MNVTRSLRALPAVLVAAVVVFAQVGLVLAPSQLGRNPLLILALRPTPAFLVLVADAVDPLVAVLIAGAGRTMVDVAYFATVRHGAAPLLERLGIGRKVTSELSGTTATRGLLAVTFFWSSSPVIAAIGLGRTSASLFVAVTGLGNLATSSLYVLSGRQLGAALAPVHTWLSVNGTWLTVAMAAAVTVSATVAARRHRGASGEPAPTGAPLGHSSVRSSERRRVRTARRRRWRDGRGGAAARAVRPRRERARTGGHERG